MECMSKCYRRIVGYQILRVHECNDACIPCVKCVQALPCINTLLAAGKSQLDAS